jgi:hypothetical protein
VADAITVIRRHGGQIAYVRVGFEDADYDAVPPHSRMAPLVAARGRALHSESPATAVHNHIAPEPSEIIVRKTLVGAQHIPLSGRDRPIHQNVRGTARPLRAFLRVLVGARRKDTRPTLGRA